MFRVKIFLLSALSVVFFSSVSLAQSTSTSLIDFSTLTTAVQTDVTSAITAVLPFLGILLGAFLGFKMFKRFTGART